MRRITPSLAVLVFAWSRAAAAQPLAVPTESVAAVSVPAGGVVAGYDILGTLIDSRAHVEELLRSVVPPGSPFVESGPADRLGAPIGTVPRLVATLAAVGYDSVVQPKAGAGGVTLQVRLRPYDRIRRVFVSGNWPLREAEVQGKLTYRPGQALPAPGRNRDEAIERERLRIVDFLRSEGYVAAKARVTLHAGCADLVFKVICSDRPAKGLPAAFDMWLAIDLGPGFPIGRIQVTGNTAIPSVDVEDELRHLDGRWLWTRPAPYVAKRLRQDAEEITKRYRDTGFPGARVSAEFDPVTGIDPANRNVSVKVKIAERKRVEVVFEGNRSGSAGELRKAVTIFDHGSYDDYEITASADALRSYYQANGFFFARVSGRRERVSADADRIVFTIDEGPELKVRDVAFTGNRFFDASEFAEVVMVRPYPFLGLGGGGYVTGRQIELDAAKLVNHYREHGFPDATARGQAATARDALGTVGAMDAAPKITPGQESGIFVRFVINEGPRVFVDRVRFVAVNGSLPRDVDFLERSVRLSPGKPLLPAALKDDRVRLERVMGDAGYPSASIEPEQHRVGDRVEIVWKMNPGPPKRLGPLFIRGNFFTEKETITEQIPLVPGDPLTTFAIERGQRNVELMQLFNRARLEFPGREQPDREVVPMVIEVEERHDNWGMLRAGVGASTEQAPIDSSFPLGVYASGGYEHRNLLGHGWNVAARGDIGNSLKRASAGFVDRRFFATLFRLEIAGSALSQATVSLGDVRSGGGSVGFAREMYPGLDMALRYNLRNTTRTEPLLRGAGASAGQGTVQLGTAVGSVSAQVDWLRLDNRLVPTQGVKLTAGVEVAVPSLSFNWGDDAFAKVTVRETSVLPLGRRLGIRHSLRWDQGFSLAGASVLPKVERFFAGGDTTIRGFALDRARTETVRAPSGQTYPLVSYQPIGGSMRLIQNVDFQIPLQGSFYGILFLDDGVLVDSFDALRFQDFRHGAGLGLAVRLPVGDISVAWGWPLDPHPGDSRIGRLHVNIGLMF